MTPPANQPRSKPGLALQILLTGLVLLSLVGLVDQSINPSARHLAGLTLDRLSAVLGLLVAGVGSVVFAFAREYLDGEPRRPYFLRTLAFSVTAAFVFMLATNLLLLFGAWLLTSIGLHQLLTYYPDRPEALPPARKKFLISRLGDVALIWAFALIWQTSHTLDLTAFLAQLSSGDPTSNQSLIAILITVAALTKSAQFPFHSWLPETMESPTPVSALMHAGIINAGGALLIRFAPLISRCLPALLLLTIIGTLTACLGMIAMWAQIKIKRTLAWSTVSQMGFMMIQCGLAAYPAAVLHIVGHGSYKAYSFLRSGTLPASTPKTSISPLTSLLLAAAGTIVATPLILVSANIVGLHWSESPTTLGLLAVVILALGQLWVTLFASSPKNSATVLPRFAMSIFITALAAFLAVALYRGADLFFQPVLGTLSAPQGPWAWGLIAIPLSGLVLLICFHACLPRIAPTRVGRALHVHALHGFYFGAIADRCVESLRLTFAGKESIHA